MVILLIWKNNSVICTSEACSIYMEKEKETVAHRHHYRVTLNAESPRGPSGKLGPIALEMLQEHSERQSLPWKAYHLSRVGGETKAEKDQVTSWVSYSRAAAELGMEPSSSCLMVCYLS